MNRMDVRGVGRVFLSDRSHRVTPHSASNAPRSPQRTWRPATRHESPARSPRSDPQSAWRNHSTKLITLVAARLGGVAPRVLDTDDDDTGREIGLAAAAL